MTPFPRGSYNAWSTRPAESLTKGIPHIHPISRRLVSIAVFSLAFPATPSFSAVVSVRTTAQDARGATFEITPQAARFDSMSVEGAPYVRVSMPGAYTADSPGSPKLPTLMISVGVPDGMSARARVVSADWEERSGLPPPLPVMKQRFVADDPKTGPVSEVRYDPDPAIYGRGGIWPREAVSLGEGGPLGDSWMMPAIVRAVRYDPGHRRFSVLKRMTLRVDFVQATARELSLRPAVRPGADVGVWQHVQRTMLGNYESARAFPRRATVGAKPARLPSRAPRRAGAVNPEFRISVTASGWSSVSYSSMAAAGFPAGVAISQVGVWERGYDDVGDSATSTPIPVVGRDANTNGVFDSGDAITFYARNLRDRVGPLSIENRYAYANVYWLTWTGAAAAVPDSVSGVIPGSPAVPTSFLDTIHLEQNSYLMPWPNATVGTPIENVEYMFMTDGSEPDQFNTSIPFRHPDTSAPFRIQARYQGKANTTHRLNIFYQSSNGTTDTLVASQDSFGQEIYVLDTGFTIPGTLIGPGTNRYMHTGFVRFSGNPTFFPGSQAYLDWVDATYSRMYIADGNRLEFTSGTAAGVTELTVSGFTQPGIEVYDLTAPTAPLRVTGLTVAPVGPGNYQVTFRTDAGGGARRFVALVPGGEAVIAASAVRQDTPSALGTPAPFPPGAFARAILITPEEFLTPANRLADYRRTQGYVVEVASMQDVYDEFSGGVKSATAIRRYFQHAYNAWTPRPSFAAILGDASMDYRHDLARSSVDWVPTYVAFETIGGPNGRELVASDAAYVLNLGKGTSTASQFTPSVFLGRVPASSAAELDQYVTKVIQYENFQPTDTWRGRQLLFSDDEYSTTIFFTGGYCSQPAEAAFQAASANMANVASSSASGSDIVTELLDLKYFTDSTPACQLPGNPNCRNLQCVANEVRRFGGAAESLFTEIAKGNLIFNVQAHANRRLITHELIYEFPDIGRIQNIGRPFFYMVWGCHANQFPDAPFPPGDIDSTDAIGEQWMMLPDRGAIGGLGSTAFELIDTNAAMNHHVAEAFYTTPPAPPPPPGQPRQARWILGEVVGQAYVRNADSTSSFLQHAMNLTVVLFGDPMVRMDALPPRAFEVTVDGTPFPDTGPLTSDSPTASAALVAKFRDEAGLTKTDLAERSVATGTITPLDSTLYSVAVSDTGRAHTLTASIRPRVGNYDLLVRSTDTNGRERAFALQVRSTTRYLANGVVIVNGTFVESNAILRAEVTTPIPVTADSLRLLLDGVPLANVTETAMDGTGRRWALVTLAEDRGPGLHTVDVEISGRTGVFPQATFNVETSLSLRRVVVVSPRLMGAGCDGSVFQFELSTPAPKVELLLMTVSGRRVASVQWPGKAGFNVYCWDGRDSQGNTAANGLYFYRLTAVDAAGHKATQSGRMIRAR